MSDERHGRDQSEDIREDAGNGRRDFLKLAGIAAGSAALGAAAIALKPGNETSAAVGSASGYSTSVRLKAVSLNCGFSGCFGASGTPVPGGAVVAVVPQRNKAGELLSVRLLADNPNTCLSITLDANGVGQNYREYPGGFFAAYQGVGKYGPWHLARYDTVNSRYILHFEGPVPFGSSIAVAINNGFNSVPSNVSVDVEWVENA